MKEKIDYTYDGKKNYSYSKFEGPKFLDAYINSRKKTLALLGKLEPVKKSELTEGLLKFYEVTKSMGDIIGYAILSINLTFALQETKDIRYLNVCLKINDALCTKISLLKSKFIKRCAYTSLNIELEEVQKLMKKRVL